MSRPNKLWEIPIRLMPLEVAALTISAGVSTFGIYTIVNPLITEKIKLVTMLLFFVGFFVLIDRLRRGSLASYLNSKLSQLVESFMDGTIQLNCKTINLTPTKTKWFSGLLGVIFTSVIFSADIFGGFSIYEVGKKALIEYEISTNQVYQKEVLDEKSGKKALENYNVAIAKWNTQRAIQLEDWEKDELLNKKEYNKEKLNAYASCDTSYPIAKHYYTKNKECRTQWDEANIYKPVPKPAEMIKPMLVSTTELNNSSTVIASGIESATKQATQWAEPFAKGFFALYVIFSLILNGLVLKSIFGLYDEMTRDVESDPSLYKTSYEHYEIVRRAERHGISENKQKEESETMDIRVKLSRKITDLKINGEKKKAAIKLKQHQLLEEGGYTDIIKHLRNKKFNNVDGKEFFDEFEEENSKPAPAPQPKVNEPKKIEQKEPIHQEAATTADTERPIGFKIEPTEHQSKPIIPTPPSYNKNGYFNNGYDLTLAIICLFNYGNIGKNQELLSNPKLKKCYDDNPLMRSELKLNQISSLVKGPLKKKGLIYATKGHPDRAGYELDEVLSQLNLEAYAKEILA